MAAPAAAAEMVDGRPAEYGLSLKELRELMEQRGAEGYDLIISKYNGVTEMCKKVYTSPNEGELLPDNLMAKKT